MTKAQVNDWLLRLFGLVGLLATVVLAGHRSKYPVLFGLYSTRYAVMLLGLVVVSLGLMAVSVPRWRGRWLTEPDDTASPRLAWSILVFGWLSLPASFFSLRAILPAGENRDLLISFALIALAVMFGLVLWRRGFAVGSGLRPHLLWLTLLFAFQLLVVALVIGKVPYVNLTDELWYIGSAQKQFENVSRHVSFSPERNAQNWINMFVIWPVQGAYQAVFGVGILQARFFMLLVAWLATPFIYLISRRIHGPTAALFAAAISIYIPIHSNWAVNHVWMVTANVIALYAFLRFWQSQERDRGWQWSLFSCGLLATSSVEGHVYGAAYVPVFGLLLLWQLWQKRSQGATKLLHWLIAFLTGVGCFVLFYLFYHIYLPAVPLQNIPTIISATLEAERVFGESAHGIGITYGNIWKLAQYYVFSNIYEFLLLILVTSYLIWSRRRDELLVLILHGGAFLIIFSQLAHVNRYYLIFPLPLVSLGFGALMKKLQNQSEQDEKILPVFRIGEIYVLLVFVTLFTLQAVSSYDDELATESWQNAQRQAEIGRNIDVLLPAGDFVIAGGKGYFLGMGNRTGYWGYFSFAWELDWAWPLELPQAIIVTLGEDDGFIGLADWMSKKDYAPVACYPLAIDAEDERVAILYSLPTIENDETPMNCSPEVLNWHD